MKKLLLALLLLIAAPPALADVGIPYLTKGRADALYCKLSGCTMTGSLALANGVTLSSPANEAFQITDGSKALRHDLSGLSSARIITWPDSALTIVGLDTTQTLTNKTFGVGTGGATAKASGVLYTVASGFGTPASLVETEGMNYTVPGGTLTATGQALHLRVYIAFAANANTKTVKVYFGATSATLNVTTTAPNGVIGVFDVVIMRVTAIAQFLLVSGSCGTALQNPQLVVATETLASNSLFKVTMTNGTASANDIILRTGILSALP